VVKIIHVDLWIDFMLCRFDQQCIDLRLKEDRLVKHRKSKGIRFQASEPAHLLENMRILVRE